jgi:hypothetical protein
MVEVPPPPPTACWRKSSASGNTGTDCVQVARTHSYVWVRDSKDPLGPVLGFTHEEWAAFLDGVQRGEFACFGVPEDNSQAP